MIFRFAPFRSNSRFAGMLPVGRLLLEMGIVAFCPISESSYLNNAYEEET